MPAVPPESSTVPPPKIRLKITRNISGKTIVKNAAGGLRQNDLFSYLTCRSTTATGRTYVPPFVPGAPASARKTSSSEGAETESSRSSTPSPTAQPVSTWSALVASRVVIT